MMNPFALEDDYDSIRYVPLPPGIHCASCHRRAEELGPKEDICCLKDYVQGQTIWRIDLTYLCGTPRVPRPSHHFVAADTEEDVRQSLPEWIKRDFMWRVTVKKLD